MFAVIFEVQPREGQRDAYLARGRLLRPELEQVEGFVDNVRYRSFTREGWILSLSTWRDEKSVVRWRTHARHHEAQEQGRAALLADYHLRVGEVTHDTQVPQGHTLRQQRLDETEVGPGTAMTLTTGSGMGLGEPAQQLGLDKAADGLVAWDVFDAVLTPGDVILLQTWRDAAAARAHAGPAPMRTRQVRIVRDYGMRDRREAPQFYPAIDP